MKRQRLFTRRIERLVLLLIALFALSAATPVRAVEPSFYRIQYTPSGDGAHMVIGFQGYSHSPEIEVVNGRLGTVSIAGQGGQFHGAIAVRLNWCDSRLLLDGRIVAEQTCLRFPFVAVGR